MPTREQVLRLVAQGHDYEHIGGLLGIPAGQAYLIATGVPADGGDTYPPEERRRPGLLSSGQHLANPPHENPTSKESVLRWIKARVGRDAQMRAAAAGRDAEPGEIEDQREDHDVLVVLTRDHNQVRALQEQLEALPGHRTGGGAAHLERRKSIVDMITVKLSEHEAVEEQYFWPAVKEALADGEERAGVATSQEQEGKDTLTALGRLAPDTDEFDEMVEQLIVLLRKHVAYEEKVFLDLRAAMPDDARQRLGDKIVRAKRLAPTRPHAHTPPKPAVLKTVGPAAAAMDKLRDAAGDRPAKQRGRAGRHAADEEPGDED